MTDDARLTELEIRYTLQQDLLLALSDVVARQDKELAQLRRDLLALRESLTADRQAPDADERPPHY